VRDAVGAGFPVAVKLNSADFQKGGFSLEESTQVAVWLDADGVDLIELSGGTYERMSFVNGTGDGRRDSTRRREAYFLDYARELRKAVRAPLMVTGGFRSAAAMEEALVTDGIDMIGLARPLCVDPDAAGALLRGAMARVGIDEAGLMPARGALGAEARNRLVTLVNTVSAVEYYGRQMTRMSRGQAPQTRHRHSALATFLRYLATTTLKALRRRIA
jgi:2,4-dienoyl-CoA reductase-like NADH-dependent reductase (Old Yellow Enzyme family)